MNTRTRSTRRKHRQKLGGKFRRAWFKHMTKKKRGTGKKCTMRKRK